MSARRCVAFLLVWAMASAAAGDAARDIKDAPPELRPALAFQRFLRVTRKTESMEDVLPLISEKEARMARFAQEHYDPESLRETLSEGGDLSQETIDDMLSRTPYEAALRNYKSIAKQVKEYVRTEIDGATATVHVKASTGATILDGKATLLLEGGDWKLDEFDVDYTKLFDKFR